MKKLLLVTLFSLILVVSLLVGACSQQTTTPAPASAAAAAFNAANPTNPAGPSTTTNPPAPAAAVKVIELKYSAFCNPSMAIGKILQQTADRVYEKSGGRLKMTLFYSESLSKLQNNLKAVQSGIADMAEFNVGSNPGVNELSRITQLPFMQHSSYEEANWVFDQLYNKYPEIQNEWKGVKIMGPRHMPGFQFNFTKAEVHLPGDMKGMKLISTPSLVNLMTGSGAAPVEIGYGDWYMSLERGLVEGLPTHLVAAYAMKLMDLLPNHTMFGDFGCVNNLEVLMINQDIWKSLPQDLQQVLDESIKWRVQTITQSDSDQLIEATKYAKDKGHKFVNLTPAELQQWVDLANTTQHQKWIKDNAGTGPTQAIHDEALKLIKEYKK
jgi:TRAP-type transport system periplasmic protein